MATSEEEWIAAGKGFMENYEFPCVGVWDGFEVHVSTHLKNYCSFKNRYTITNMGLISYNKRFLALTVGAPCSTHNALQKKLLLQKSFQRYYCNGCYTWQSYNLGGEFGEIPLVTIRDNAFPHFAWLLKMFNENTHRFPGMLL